MNATHTIRFALSPRLTLATLLLTLPLAQASADPERFRVGVGRILEQHGIVGNATLERNAQANPARATSANSGPQSPHDSQDADAVPLPLDQASAAESATRVAGVIVRFASAELAARAAANLPPTDALLDAVIAASSIPLEYKRPMSLGRFVFTFPEAIGMQDYHELEALLLQLPEVESVDPETIVSAQLVPGNPYFYYQWNLRETGTYSNHTGSTVIGINAVTAWDLATSYSQTTVAVLDSGMTDPLPIEAFRVLPGYDFISDPARARDGDGRDDDPFDNGDYREENECEHYPDAAVSSWHGAGMTSLIAAAGNANNRVAGIDWGANILPVRVLGRCGGASSDILDGMLWAAGVAVPGVPINTNPARIINMSLGSLETSACSNVYQLAFNVVKLYGVTVVASAGNDNAEAALHEPSNCSGPIAVGAVDHYGERATYSNWSTQGAVDISVPVGDRARHGNSGAIVALSDDGETVPTGEQTTVWSGGTSAAAALVSGSLSLAQRLDAKQHPDLLVAIMLETAQPFGNGTDCDLNEMKCGVGILDLEALIQGALVLQDYAVVREFYHSGLKHWFRSGNWDEVSLLVSGAFGEWDEFDDWFLAWRDGSAIATHPVCRFYGTPGVGPNSHFYTVDKDECEFLKQNDPGWTYEGTAFYAKKPSASGTCPRNTKRLYRYYNQMAHVNDSNHRFTTTLNDKAEMEAAGWVLEGVAMCVPV